MDAGVFQRFQTLIRTRTGLALHQRDFSKLESNVAGRVASLKLSDAEKYLEVLDSNSGSSRAEWDVLIALLTNGESYFFRDRGQFTLLETKILPELIELRAAIKRLRIWSAGCSTGEEAYSLAAVINETLPDRRDWDIRIIGTDINLKALERAREGFYSAWSFRSVSEVQMKAFQRVGEGWRVREPIRQMVSFQRCNLLEDPFPNSRSGLESMDLILCRNVFIYFGPEAIELVARKLINTLAPEGYLMTGHAELPAFGLDWLQGRVFSESTIYQRKSSGIDSGTATTRPSQKMFSHPARTMKRGAETKPAIKRGAELKPAAGRHPAAKNHLVATLHAGARLRVQTPSESNGTSPNPLEAASQQLESGNPAAAIAAAQKTLAADPRSIPALCLLARAYANTGQYRLAEDACSTVIELNPHHSDAYYLLAQIAEHEGNVEEARRLLRKVIFLQPDHVAAHLDLAAVFDRGGDITRARKTRRTALELVRKLPPDQVLQPYTHTTAGELASYLESSDSQKAVP